MLTCYYKDRLADNLAYSLKNKDSELLSICHSEINDLLAFLIIVFLLCVTHILGGGALQLTIKIIFYPSPHQDLFILILFLEILLNARGTVSSFCNVVYMHP